MIEAHAVMQQAREAARVLERSSLAQRLGELRQLQERILARSEEIADVIMADTGKTRTDALVSEVMGVLDALRWLRGAAPGALADERVSTPLALFGKRSRIWYEPLGVVLIITPWNYPFHIAMTALAPAFAAGNAVLLKPSEHAPLSGLLQSLVQGLPLLSQALQVVPGDGDTARALVEQGPDKVFFTGSPATGRRLLAQCAPRLIPVDLELGGKDAMIVFEDVDLRRTAAGALWGALTNAGQSCTAVERLYVQASLHDALVDRLRQELDTLVVNEGDAGDADIGGMTVPFQCQHVLEHLQDAREQGARVQGGEPIPGTRLLTPALVTGATDSLRIVREETFGPVLVVLPFQSEAEVIARANALPFGLSASVWSRDLTRAERVSRALRVGAVSINNVMLTEGNPALPFGGQGESGFGRAKGVVGLRAMTRIKSVLIDRQSHRIEANWYPYTRTKYRLFQDLIRGLFGQGIRSWVRFLHSGLKLESTAQKSREDC